MLIFKDNGYSLMKCDYVTKNNCQFLNCDYCLYENRKTYLSTEFLKVVLVKMLFFEYETEI